MKILVEILKIGKKGLVAMEDTNLFKGDMDRSLNSVPLNRVQILDCIAQEICNECKSYFAFKGGYELTKLLENPRATRDIDLSIQDEKDYEEFKVVLNNIGHKLVDLGVIKNYLVKDKISLTSSGGIECYSEEGNRLFGVDIGLHQLVSGIGKLDFKFGIVNAFVPERMLADKIRAILSEKRFRRTKDLYDCYVLVQNYDLDFLELKKLVNERIGQQVELWDNIPFSDTVLVKYSHAWDKLVLTSFFNPSQSLYKPGFQVVCSLFYKLVDPLKYNYEMVKWSSTQGRWI